MTPRSSKAQRRTGYALSQVDGSPLFFEQSGVAESSQPAAILTDGIGCDGFVWKYLTGALSTARQVVHWHYPGHGRSPVPLNRDALTIANLADGLVSVMDETGVESGVLFGHSMGVQVVLEAYRRHPRRVAAMVLLCGMCENPLRTFRGTDHLDSLLPRLRALVGRAPGLFNAASRLLTPTKLAYTLASKLEINADLLDRSDFMPYLRGLSLIDVPLFLTMLSGAQEHSAADLLPSITVPTLVVAGGRDGFTPPSLSEEMAESIPSAELLLIEDGSHTAPIERPERIGDAVRTFLSRVERAQCTGTVERAESIL